jgi:drug/metabolite transporter (DMT)-like permease
VPPQWVFWVMAGLTSVDAILTTVEISKRAAYGALQVLLFQTRVPVSMLFTKLLINGRKYRASHYIGAFLVVCGILVTLLPDLGAQAPGSSDILPGVMIILLDSIPSALFLVAQERLLASNCTPWTSTTCSA